MRQATPRNTALHRCAPAVPSISNATWGFSVIAVAFVPGEVRQ